MQIPSSLLPLLAALVIALPAIAAADPPVPAEIEQFATGQWSVEQYKYGDLTGRKTKDAAILLSVNAQHAFGDAQDRKLLIALRGADGKLRRITDATNAIPLGAGPAGGDPDLGIARNSVFISQFGGSREKGTDKYQYKNIDGTWRLIGMTSEWYDSLAENIPTSKVDVNFLTSYVEASLTDQANKAQRVAFYEIQSVKATPPASGPWSSAPYLVLKSKNPADLTARVQSMHDANTLYVRVTADDDSVLPEDSVNLLDQSGNVIEPAKRLRTALPHGYEETLSFNIKKKPFADSLPTIPIEAAFAPITLKIVDADKDAPALKTLTTAVSAKGIKPHGGLLLLPMPTTPTLQNVDIRDGSVHPLVFPV